ncbi:hypothetical protein [Sphingomonas sp. Root50]|uniref:hypothetical protein n=1 Tax=Sphingomonas sp. Root50 TaxID=1736551 RepID=UPI00138F6C70|nr:hypothetical protein [Sphingomonas sp. Root50]
MDIGKVVDPLAAARRRRTLDHDRPVVPAVKIFDRVRDLASHAPKWNKTRTHGKAAARNDLV